MLRLTVLSFGPLAKLLFMRDKKQNKQSELKSNINSKRPSPESKPWRKLLEKRLSKKD